MTTNQIKKTYKEKGKGECVCIEVKILVRKRENLEITKSYGWNSMEI
jgi:hypothetical protein